MPEALWLPVRFRDNEVFARASADGQLVEKKGGLVEFVYKPGGKVYATRAERLQPVGDATPRTLETSDTAPPRARSAARASAAGTSQKKKPSRRFQAMTLADRRVGHAIQLWTDGACSYNPGPAGAGVYYEFDGDVREISEWLGEGTNNIAELTAILRAIEMLDDRRAPVDIMSDSTYCIGLLTQGWKPKKNQALVAQLREAFNSLSDVRLIKVKGHAGIDGNERADELARLAVENRRTTRVP